MRREWIEIRSCVFGIRDRMRLPPCGGSGLKWNPPFVECGIRLSPSMRREWIEIRIYASKLRHDGSPSMRREWIEIILACIRRCRTWSPSMRREWIEIPVMVRNPRTLRGLPPCGGSGLKCFRRLQLRINHSSPSMRREWIEIVV